MNHKEELFFIVEEAHDLVVISLYGRNTDVDDIVKKISIIESDKSGFRLYFWEIVYAIVDRNITTNLLIDTQNYKKLIEVFGRTFLTDTSRTWKKIRLPYYNLHQFHSYH